MKKQKTNPSTISTYNSIKKIRNDWGNINPITKIIPNKKKDYFNESYFDEYYSMDDCCHDLELKPPYPDYYDEELIEKLEKYDDFDWEYDIDLDDWSEY